MGCPVSRADDGAKNLNFMAICFAITLLLSILDSILFAIKKKSILRMDSREKTSLLRLFFVPLGAAIVGLIGRRAEILQDTVAASIAVAVSWQSLLSEFTGLRNLDTEKDDDKPVRELGPAEETMGFKRKDQ